MSKIKNLKGQRFGNLTIVSYSHTNSTAQTCWNCLCDCGRTTVRRSDTLQRNPRVTCGDKEHIAKGPTSSRWRGFEEISGLMWKRLERDAKRRNLTFNISIEEVWKLFIAQQSKCKLSGLPITFGKYAKDRTGTASLDRKDSKKGYEKDNVQWVHVRINFMKGALPEHEFKQLCSCVHTQSTQEFLKAL